jgi:Concanavalin A-like lectin/glucanases superfamily
MKSNNFLKTSLALGIAFSTLISCGSDDDTPTTPTLPPIGGFASSDAVGANDLVAKWSFENNITESKNNLAGTPTGVSYVAGAKGQAWDGSATTSRYAVFNGATAIGALNNFTFSFWINSANTVPDAGVPGQGKGAQGIFSLVKPTEFWGAINIFLENQDTAFPNKMRLKLLAENKRSGVEFVTYAPIVNIDNQINKWVHVVFTYNATSSKISVYVNGLPATSVEGPYAPEGGFPGSFTAYASNSGGLTNPNNAPLWGALDFGGTFNQVVIGSHQFETTPSLTSSHGQEDWATSFVGKLDEFRVYKAALSGSDVGALYELEKAGR